MKFSKANIKNTSMRAYCQTKNCGWHGKFTTEEEVVVKDIERHLKAKPTHDVGIEIKQTSFKSIVDS